MRLGLLTTSFPRFEGDVAGTFVLGMARALAARGHTLDVLAPEPSEPVPQWSPGPGVTLTPVPYLRPRVLERTFYGAGAPDNLGRDPLAWLGAAPFSIALLAAARKRVPAWDALISHWLLPCGAVAAAVRGRRPHLAVSHSADTHLLARLPGRGVVARRLLRGATALLFASSDGRARFAAALHPGDHGAFQSIAHVSPMGIDPPAPRAAGDRARLRKAARLEGFVVLVLARLVPIKGVADLAFALEGEAGVTVLVAGDGPERAAIEDAFHAQGVDARMLGTVTGPRRDELFVIADCLVVPSRTMPGGRTEGAPTAALEAMAAGLPVIATRTGGLPDIVLDGKVGLLVPPEDPAALRAALRTLRDDPAARRRMGQRAARHAAAFNWTDLAEGLEGLLVG
jgi:glycosyltransferase involved in cell wall biosynthesis